MLNTTQLAWIIEIRKEKARCRQTPGEEEDRMKKL